MELIMKIEFEITNDGIEVNNDDYLEASTTLATSIGFRPKVIRGEENTAIKFEHNERNLQSYFELLEAFLIKKAR